MKIGIGVGSYQRWGNERYKKINQHGFSCVDFNMMDTKHFPYDDSIIQTQEKLDFEKRLADESNIQIYQVHGPWHWPPNDSTQELRDAKLEHIKRSLWATSVLGCKKWVLHPIMPCGISEKGTEEQKITFDVNFSFMDKVLEIAKPYDITVCLENMPMRDFSLATPYEILDFVKIINDQHFKICLDTGHVATFPELSVTSVIRDLGNEIHAFHLHDSFPDRDLHLLPYFGRIDWSDFSAALKEINYTGGLCLETAPPHNLPTDIYEELCIALAKIVDHMVGN
ncbi:MAG: sugar phosphate isomerase/epimerase [Clostridia bacterium]|nr:sugar phosphate isomerase/epimerase [Clostridia bacterium]